MGEEDGNEEGEEEEEEQEDGLQEGVVCVAPCALNVPNLMCCFMLLQYQFAAF